MSVIIPEILLFNLISGIVKHVELDLIENASNTQNSFLGRILMGVKDSKYDYFEEASNLFSRKKDNPRAIITRLFFDAALANIPTIHITMPQETSGNNSLGGGESDVYYENTLEQTVTPEMERRFDTTFNIIITSDNHREVLVIYHVIRAMLVSALAEVDIAGLENPKLGGQDIRLQEDMALKNIFMRGISLQCSYEVEVPRFFNKEKITQLIINPGTIINPISTQNGLQNQITLDPNN